MNIIYDNGFWYDQEDEKSRVFQVLPHVYKDNRGSFSEVLKYIGEWKSRETCPLWFSNLDWVRQINRSKSTSGVIRGCHAQKGIFCQGKLVEAINRDIYDIITDARPNSETFGVSKIFHLNNEKQNQLWVPRGFLHAFIIPYEENNEKEAIFNYYVDNTYNKNSEICINPSTLVPKIVKLMTESKEDIEIFGNLYKMFETESKLIYSEKDMNGLNYEEFMKNIRSEYSESGKLWYK